MPTALMNTSCSLMPVALFLADHKADTLQGVVDAAQAFTASNPQEGIHFALAAGNAGIEAATNDVIASKQVFMLLLVYAVVTFMVFLTFRNLRAVVCIMVPLSITASHSWSCVPTAPKWALRSV